MILLHPSLVLHQSTLQCTLINYDAYQSTVPATGKLRTNVDTDARVTIFIKLQVILTTIQAIINMLRHSSGIMSGCCNIRHSNKPCNYKSVEMIGNSIAYWLDKLDYQIYIPCHVKFTLYVVRDELYHQHDNFPQNSTNTCTLCRTCTTTLYSWSTTT